MTKIQYSLWAFSISILIFVSSCVKDDTISGSASASEDTAISSFTLGTVTVNRYIGKKKYAKDKEGNPVDSFYTYKYAGSKTPVYIDQLTREIYNMDSLPAGSHMKMLATISAKNSATITYRDWYAAENASWTRYVTGDSIVFGVDNGEPNTLRFRVTSTQGGYTRDYKVRIVNHLEYADSFKYVKMPSKAIFAGANSLKGVSTDEGVYVLVGKETESKLYCGKDFCNTWEEVVIKIGDATKTLGGDATIVSDEDNLYVLDGNTLYSCSNGEAWNSTDVTGLKVLAGACKNEVYAMTSEGKIVMAKRSNLSMWEKDAVFSDAEKLPTRHISSISMVQKANSEVSRITVIGNKASYLGTDTLAVIWNKNVNEVQPEEWIYNDMLDAAAKKHGLPAMDYLSATGYYNGWILAIGGYALAPSIDTGAYSRIFCSEDGGISWHILKGLKMPFDNLLKTKPVLIVADLDGYFYLISADEGQMFRCKLNNATWSPMEYTEYK